MSDSPKPDLARLWLGAEKLIEEEADRLATMSDEDFEREMDALPDPGHVPTAEELLARAAERAAKGIDGAGAGPAPSTKVVALPVRRRTMSWLVALVAAALCAIVIAFALRQSDDHVAAPLPAEVLAAAKLREEAFAACDASQWRACRNKLRDAKALDPAGDGDARVQAAYKTALEGLGFEAGPTGPR